jgi:cell division protein FtsI/penicillin-binding protein 2
VSALGSYSGGIAVGDPSTGEVLALAGQAFSILQPPGSVFKIITATAALEDKKVTAREEFPIETGHSIEGYFLPNANGEACGGTFINSIAHSCNSVFGPLGVEVGAQRLVQTAERYGYNKPIGIPGAETSLIPPANQITSDLQVGTSAIGQDKVQTTPLEMMTVAGTIGMNGRRAQPTLRAGANPKLDTVTTPEVARVIKQGMAGVVQYGTAKDSGQIPGLAYAGKTGTAELGEGIESDAWFVAFAPLQRPKIAVGVLLIQAGFGGKVAAPVAAQLIEQVLR